jgi:hypothetical protein
MMYPTSFCRSDVGFVLFPVQILFALTIFGCALLCAFEADGSVSVISCTAAPVLRLVIVLNIYISQMK